jgi:hypothetical protein
LNCNRDVSKLAAAARLARQSWPRLGCAILTSDHPAGERLALCRRKIVHI